MDTVAAAAAAGNWGKDNIGLLFIKFLRVAVARLPSGRWCVQTREQKVRELQQTFFQVFMSEDYKQQKTGSGKRLMQARQYYCP